MTINWLNFFSWLLIALDLEQFESFAFSAFLEMLEDYTLTVITAVVQEFDLVDFESKENFKYLTLLILFLLILI